MTKEEITENNKLIAEFIGLSSEGNCYVSENIMFDPILNEYNEGYIGKERMLFHNSWDWLMPVVEKIESLDFVVTTKLNSCFIKEFEHEINNKAIWRGKHHSKTSKIEATYKAVIDFINWYNKQK